MLRCPRLPPPDIPTLLPSASINSTLPDPPSLPSCHPLYLPCRNPAAFTTDYSDPASCPITPGRGRGLSERLTVGACRGLAGCVRLAHRGCRTVQRGSARAGPLQSLAVLLNPPISHPLRPLSPLCPPPPPPPPLLSAPPQAKGAEWSPSQFVHLAGSWLAVSAVAALALGWAFLALFRHNSGLMTRVTIWSQVLVSCGAPSAPPPAAPPLTTLLLSPAAAFCRGIAAP